MSLSQTRAISYIHSSLIKSQLSIREMIEKISVSTVFSMLDIEWDYMKIGSQYGWETSFIKDCEFKTEKENFVSTFQYELHYVLREFIDHGLEIFFDYIIVHTRTSEGHRELLRCLVHRFTSLGIRLVQNKCKFFVKEIEFFGYAISFGQVTTSPEKIKAIIEFPLPTNRKQVHQFVALVNFYRNFIHRFSHIAAPLHLLMRKDAAFYWTTVQQEAFDALKRCFNDSLLLKTFDSNKQLSKQMVHLSDSALFI